MLTEITIKFDAQNLRIVQMGLTALQMQAQACEAWFNAQINAAVVANQQAAAEQQTLKSRNGANGHLSESHTVEA